MLTRFLEDVQTFSADFEQEIWADDLEIDEVATGTVELKRPNRFAWRYATPYEQLIIADGANLWMYDADIKQATKSRLEEGDASSPAMLLVGDATLADTFRLVDDSTQEGVQWVTLAPIATDTEFDSVRLGFEAEQLTRLEFVNGLDQTTVIRFASIETNGPLPDEDFQFNPPRGTHILGDAD